MPGPDAPCTHTVCFPQPKPSIYYIEVFSMIVFTLDYLARVACVHAVPYRWVGVFGFVFGGLVWFYFRLDRDDGAIIGVLFASQRLKMHHCACHHTNDHRLIHPESYVKGYLVRSSRGLRVCFMDGKA